jgi:hypothetical protein
MNTDVELLLREGLDRLTAEARVPAGLAGRIIARRRRRRVAACGAAAAAAVVIAVVTVVTVAATGGLAGPGAGTRARAAASPASTGPALATAYVVSRVENALANDGRVMRETQSVAPNSGGAAYFDGQLSYQTVTWAYQGHSNTDTFGARGQLQAAMGTGIINGKLQGVQVDYIRHGWELIPGVLSAAPVNACTAAGFGEATTDPGTNWPLLIERTLACGGYKMAGYAEIDGAETVKITGSRVVDIQQAGHFRLTDTLFVSSSTYLPARIIESVAGPGQHASPTSADLQWLAPTAVNRARASVTVPCGYRQISWPSGEMAKGQPAIACQRDARQTR